MNLIHCSLLHIKHNNLRNEAVAVRFIVVYFDPLWLARCITAVATTAINSVLKRNDIQKLCFDLVTLLYCMYVYNFMSYV